MISSLLRRLRVFYGLVILGGACISTLPYVQSSNGQERADSKPAAEVGTPEQIEAGKTLFAAQCSFCHGRDAGGGESGPDLMASTLVEQDVRGEKISVVVRNGRMDKGMPAFQHTDAELASIVAFIHDRKAKAKEGRRRTVDPSDLQTGNAEAGMRYFNGAGGCAKCHSPNDDLKGIAARLQGLDLLRRMLYPEEERGEPATADGRPPKSTKAIPTVTVTLPSGQIVTGKLAYRDEFTIGVTDAAGWYHSWATGQVKAVVTNPLEAHAELLKRYSEQDMHDVLAYLQTLR